MHMMAVLRVTESQNSGHLKPAASLDRGFLEGILRMNRIIKEERNGGHLRQLQKYEQRPSSWKASKISIQKKSLW